MAQVNGRAIYGRIINATITTATEVTWEDKNGNSVTLQVGDRINLIDIVISTAATAKDVILFQDHDGDDALHSGEEIVPRIEFAGQGTFGIGLGADLSLRKINATGSNGLFAIASTTGTVSVLLSATLSRS